MQAAISANRAEALDFPADAAAHFSRGSRGCAVDGALLGSKLRREELKANAYVSTAT